MKKKRTFYLYKYKTRYLLTIFAVGVIYPESNVQINWRADIGYCQQQYASMDAVLQLVSDISAITFTI